MVQSQRNLNQRLKLQRVLEDSLGSSNVYFQPPANTKIAYPAIIYQRVAKDERFANNLLYNNTVRYQVTVIDRDPDSFIPEKVALLPLCSFSRHFVAESLNHDVFDLYY